MCDMIHSYVTRLILISHDSFVSDMTHSYVTILIHMWPYLLMSHVRIINETIRPTQSIMYVPLQVNRSQKCILLIVQYKYIKPCSGDFNSPESDPPHKIMRYWIYYSTQLCFWISTWQNLSDGNDLYWRCTSFEKGISAEPALKYFTWFIGAGGLMSVVSLMIRTWLIHMCKNDYQWVLSHINEYCHIWMSLATATGIILTQTNESCHVQMSHVTCESSMSIIKYKWVLSNTNES